MKQFLEDWGVTICGALTSILTAIIVLLFQKLTGFNFFTFSIWLVVPVGALLTGFAAASGYMFGSLYFHHRPTKMLLLNMVAIAASTQFLIYYLEYSTVLLDDGTSASSVIGFLEYLDISLTKAKYSVGRTLHSGIEVGNFGYGLAFIQFLGFIAGGVAVYFKLKSKAMCEKCQKYYRTLSSKIQTFKTTDDFKVFAERFHGVEMFSAKYIECLNENHHENQLFRVM